MSGRPWSLDDPALDGARVALDSNVLIYLLEADPELGPRAGDLLDAAEAGRLDLCMATLAIAEVLVGPARTGDGARFEALASELRDLPVEIRALDHAIAEDAAWLRGAGAGLDDAVHLATALASRASVFVTNDRRISSLPRLEVRYLADMGRQPR